MSPDLSNTIDSVAGGPGFEIPGWPVFLVMIAILFPLCGWPAMKIARRAGRPAWAGALTSVPMLNVVVIWAFATSGWPALDRPYMPSDGPGGME